MQTANASAPLPQDLLGTLQKVLDLAMQTAESARTEGNHKLVLQAVREVTRIVTLMTKLAKTPDKEGKGTTKTARKPAKTPVRSPQLSYLETLSPVEEYELYQKMFPDLFQPQPSQATADQRLPLSREVGKSGKLPG